MLHSRKGVLVLSVFLFFALFLSSCSGAIGTNIEGKKSANTEQEETQVSEQASFWHEGQMTISFYFGDRAGIYSGSINETGLPDGQGSFHCDSLENNWIYDGEWSNGHFNGYGTTKWDSGQEYEGEFSNDYQNGHGTLLLENGTRCEGSFVAGIFCGDGTVTFSDGGVLTGTFSNSDNGKGTYCDIDGYNYNATLSDGELNLIPCVDFFSDPDRVAQYEQLYKSYQYSELAELVNDYIENNDLTPIDNAYSILDVLTPSLAYEKQWVVNFDEFDSTYNVSFPGLHGISSSESVAVSLKKSDLQIYVGFRKSGWLFFDKIELSIDGERVYSASCKSYDVTRNVISGHTIEEYTECDFYDNVVEQLGTAEKSILRFTNTTSGEIYDHTLSQNEMDAMYYGYMLQGTYRELGNLLYRWNNK